MQTKTTQTRVETDETIQVSENKILRIVGNFDPGISKRAQEKTNEVMSILCKQGIPIMPKEILKFVMYSNGNGTCDMPQIELVRKLSEFSAQVYEQKSNGMALELADVRHRSEQLSQEIKTAIERTAVLFSGWWSGSKWNEVGNKVIETLDNVNKPLAFYLYLSKSGTLSSCENVPDLGEILFLGRLKPLNVKVVIYDEHASAGGITYSDNNSYVTRYQEMAAGIGLDLEVRAPALDPDKYAEKYVELLEEEERGEADRNIATNRIIKIMRRCEGASIEDDAVYELNAKYNAMINSRIRDETLHHVSVTAKPDKLKIGWPHGLLPLHGVPIMYEDNSKRDRFAVAIVPESGIREGFEEVHSTHTTYTIKNEQGELFAYAVTQKDNELTEQKFYDDIPVLLSKRAKSETYIKTFGDLLRKKLAPQADENQT